MKLLSPFLFLVSSTLFAQDYISYQKTFNRIDKDLLDSNYTAALERLDSIYYNYTFIYAKHCIKALQICCVADDSVRAAKFLEKSFRQGVPLWIIRNNELTKKVLQYSTTQQTIRDYDKFHAIYLSSINQNLARQIDSLIIIDQTYTKKVNDGFVPLRYTIYYIQWKRNNLKHFNIIKQITDEYGYPGERLTGLPKEIQDSTISFRNVNYYGPSIYDHRAYTMLIHYFSTPRKDMNDVLLKNVKQGYFPPDEFGAINDFMAKYDKEKHGHYVYYNVWHQDPKLENISGIDEQRNEIGLNTFVDQQMNMLVNRERRKNRVANARIITE